MAEAIHYIRTVEGKPNGHYIQYIVVIVWPSGQVVSRSGKHMDAVVSYAVISSDHRRRRRYGLALRRSAGTVCCTSERLVGEAYHDGSKNICPPRRRRRAPAGGSLCPSAVEQSVAVRRRRARDPRWPRRRGYRARAKATQMDTTGHSI